MVCVLAGSLAGSPQQNQEGAGGCRDCHDMASMGCYDLSNFDFGLEKLSDAIFSVV